MQYPIRKYTEEINELSFAKQLKYTHDKTKTDFEYKHLFIILHGFLKNCQTVFHEDFCHANYNNIDKRFHISGYAVSDDDYSMIGTKKTFQMLNNNKYVKDYFITTKHRDMDG